MADLPAVPLCPQCRHAGVPGILRQLHGHLHDGLAQLDLGVPDCPAPSNLWMNIPVEPACKIVWGEPPSKSGDHMTLSAAMDCVVVMSTCPQDMIPINGPDCKPTAVHYRLLD